MASLEGQAIRMSNEITIGDRVIHPKKTEWGIGQVTATSPPSISVYFETAGEKKLRTDLVDILKLDGQEAESSILDSKFKARRGAKKRKFDDPKYFNGGKRTSRKQFIESLGGTCKNWYATWSFVNHDDKKVFFGAWQDFIDGNRALIFSYAWKVRRGKKQGPWAGSRENIRLIEEDGYSLHVYTMILDPDSETEFELGARKIGAILNDVAQAELLNEGGDWYAVFPEEPSL